MDLEDGDYERLDQALTDLFQGPDVVDYYGDRENLEEEFTSPDGEIPDTGIGADEQHGNAAVVEIRELYEYSVKGRQQWKGAVEKQTVEMKFNPQVLKTLPDNHHMYGMAILDLASRIVPRDDPNILMGMELDADNWSAPLYVHARKVHQYTSNFLEREVESRKQSARELDTAAKNLQVTLTIFRPVSGSGRKKFIDVISALSGNRNIFLTDQDLPLDEEEQEEGEEDGPRRKKTPKRPKATITNVSSYCLGIAVARGMDNLCADTEAERRKLRAQWSRVDDSKPNASPECWQKARDLLSACGVYKTHHYDMDDVRKIQAHLSGMFQLIVINDDHDGQPIFTGKFVDRNLIIGLLYSQGHFEYIYSIPAFLGCKFYCTLCNKRGSNEKLHYNCPLKCRLCLSDNCDTHGPEEIQWLKCGVRFELNDCYRRHLQRGPQGGRSRCEKTVKCGKCSVIYYKDHGIQHICGMRFCQACKQMRQPDHTHFLRQRPLSKVFDQKRLYFDLETMAVEDAEGNLKHQVVLACALRCCPACRGTVPNNRAAALELKCKKCSPDGKRYWEFGIEGDDVLGCFGKWLFHKRHEKFSIIAHNLKGFDGQLLVQYLLRPTIPKPKMLIMNGKKINFMSIAGMRILDSFSFVPFALRKFNKAFEIDELKKGDFPFAFIKPENFNYRGPLPDRQYYGYEQKSHEAKEEFDSFYNAQLRSGAVFDFRHEIREYCYADVALLAMGMTKFEKTFYEKTDVMLFEETVTAAGAAMLVYQRKFVQPDTIALDMDASSPRIKQSALARRYLAYRQTLTASQIQSEDNIGEYKIPGTNYHVDGFVPPTTASSRGKAIEVHGCYYHACPCSYAPNQIGPDDLRSIDIRRRDQKRALFHIIRQHCDLEIVWECEIRSQAATNKVLADMLKCNIAPGTVVCREGLFGGRTEPIRLFFSTGKGKKKKLYYLDFTSLYPYVMKCCEYPVGEPMRRNSAQFNCPITMAEDLLAQCRGYVSCKVLAPTDLFLPVLPYRADKLLFTLCRSEPANPLYNTISECAEECNQETCIHTDDERALYGTWTTVELAVALQHGYRIECVYGAVHWDEWSTELFAGYINTFLKEKQEASGISRHCHTEEDILAYIDDYRQHEGIQLVRNDLRKDEVLRNIAKLLLNSLWGKFGQRVDVVSSRILTTASELFKVLNDATVEITHLDVINDSAVLIHTRPVSGTLQPLPTSALPYAIFTTAHARVRLYEAISRVPRPEENLLYMDTDSVVFAADAAAPNPLQDMCGDYLGQLTDELKGEMTDFVTIGAKSYAYRERDSDGQVTTKVKAKGFTMNSDAEEKINFQLMLDQVMARLRGDDGPVATVDYDCIRRTTGHCLVNKRMSKEFRFTFDKRVIRPDGGTVPFGFR